MIKEKPGLDSLACIAAWAFWAVITVARWLEGDAAGAERALSLSILFALMLWTTAQER